jgi:hypothetical protein
LESVGAVVISKREDKQSQVRGIDLVIQFPGEDIETADIICNLRNNGELVPVYEHRFHGKCDILIHTDCHVIVFYNLVDMIQYYHEQSSRIRFDKHGEGYIFFTFREIQHFAQRYIPKVTPIVKGPSLVDTLLTF